jgi:L-proline amide hydrolase
MKITDAPAVSTEGTMEWEGMQTWYRVVGDPDQAAGQAPVVICHGGPGATHDYLTSVTGLARSGRACVLYDQFGNGRSGHRPDAPTEFWTVDLFLRELGALVNHLGISDGYHVLGQSWGGMLAMEHALRHPSGLRSIVVADAPASTKLWMQEAERLMAELPPEVLAVLERCHADGTTDSAEYQEASAVYYQRHLCRLDPPPDEVLKTFAARESDPTVYSAMAGSSEFNPTGTLRDWDITGRLGEINIPTLVISGRFDEATPTVVEPIAKGIPGAEWVLFENSSHMPHVEERDRYIDIVEAFLARVEVTGAASA